MKQIAATLLSRILLISGKPNGSPRLSPVSSGGTVTVGASETLNAIAVAPGYNNSQMRSGIYAIH